jgi:hypothetical protein
MYLDGVVVSTMHCHKRNSGGEILLAAAQEAQLYGTILQYIYGIDGHTHTQICDAVHQVSPILCEEAVA